MNDTTESGVGSKITMNGLLLFFTCPALKQLLLSRLQVAIALYETTLSPPTAALAQLHKNLLHQAKDDSRVLYISSIAFLLSKAKNMPALEIATAIATYLSKLAQCDVGGAGEQGSRGAGEWGSRGVGEKFISAIFDVQAEIDDERAELIQVANTGDDFTIFTVEVVPPGWIYLYVSDAAIATWFQSLTLSPPASPAPPLPHSPAHLPTCPPAHLLPAPPHLFAIQHTHARCCSLICMAHREGLIELSEPDSSLPFWRAIAKDPIPWLNSEHKLVLVHPAERALIAQLLELVDNLYCPSRQTIDWGKAAFDLSQAFQTFYSRCRIWGEVKIEAIQLAQARLGLVRATQPILRLLLQDWFGVSAPLEL